MDKLCGVDELEKLKWANPKKKERKDSEYNGKEKWEGKNEKKKTRRRRIKEKKETASIN